MCPLAIECVLLQALSARVYCLLIFRCAEMTLYEKFEVTFAHRLQTKPGLAHLPFVWHDTGPGGGVMARPMEY